MKVMVTTLLLSFMVSLSAAQSTCTDQQISDYIVQQLPASCGLNLGTVFNFSVEVQQSVLNDALDVVCSENCGGQFSKWLLNNCDDALGGLGLYYWCLDPGNTAQISRCRYAVDPYFDTESFFNTTAFPCYTASLSAGSCPNGCNQALTSLVTATGCCFQGLYNNTEYFQALVGGGFARQDDLPVVQGLFSRDLWRVCQVTPPSECTMEGIEFPRSGAALVVVQSTLVVLLLMLALFA